jgi:hypothetical protein
VLVHHYLLTKRGVAFLAGRLMDRSVAGAGGFLAGFHTVVGMNMMVNGDVMVCDDVMMDRFRAMVMAMMMGGGRL